MLAGTVSEMIDKDTISGEKHKKLALMLFSKERCKEAYSGKSQI